MPRTSQTLCHCLRGFGLSTRRGTTLRSTSYLLTPSITLPTSSGEHPRTYYYGSQSVIYLIGHERYVLHFYILCNALCISCAFHTFAMYAYPLVLNTFAHYISTYFSTYLTAQNSIEWAHSLF